MADDPIARDRAAVVVGVGVTGAATARALVGRGHDVALVDDAPGDTARALAEELGLVLHDAPSVEALDALVAGAAAVIASPGLPESHAAFAVARRRGTPIVGELDLAAAWDDRPCVAITGTDGKTTVTTLVAAMLVASGVAAVEAGNTDVPLVAAIDDPTPDVFVVEASSFRLAPLRRFAPRAGCWLNFGADHQDVHLDLAGYERAKANIWRGFGPDQLAVANRDDAVVIGHARGLPRVETFGLGPAPTEGAHWRLDGDAIVSPEGAVLCRRDELHRDLPHDVTNSMAAAATARAVGATLPGAATALRAFGGLPHRVELVGERDGVRWFDDSKATTPHAALAAVRGFASVVLIAGGRNKGLDLGELVAGRAHLRAVVGLGEAGPDVVTAVESAVEARRAATMDEAVALAAALARPGDVVLLSPACASFDQYRSYAQRGEDFVRAARAIGVAPSLPTRPEPVPEVAP